MFGFFSPSYAKEADALLKSARKLLDYKRDLWSAETVADFDAQMKKLRDAAARRDEKAVAEESRRLDEMAGKFSPPPASAGWRENCEVFLVAIVIALGVRTYFLQPFTIPTGSMQPTLNGIIGHPTNEPPPGLLSRIVQKILLGRGYVDLVCEEDGSIADMQETSRLFFFTDTQIQCGGRTYTVPAARDTLINYFHVDLSREYHRGEVIARGYVDTGDHVFVDKLTYNFRTPQRGEVFVFKTTGIPKIEARLSPELGSQFYIKRLGGLPGDELRIDPPTLYQNGKRATAFGYERVMAGRDGYRGYTNASEQVRFDGTAFYFPMTYLNDPQSTFNIPQKRYFALGDNSYHSSDSRDWGTVPQQNIMGRGLLVYWPFNSHWGLIR
jgi:signal peptidase I